MLIALTVADHVHHDAAERWLADRDAPFATCPVTEGSLVRYLIRRGQDGAIARSILLSLHDHPRHEFWPDAISYREVSLAGVIGHRQVTDAYLAQLARERGGQVASLDRGLAALHGDVVQIVPTE